MLSSAQIGHVVMHVTCLTCDLNKTMTVVLYNLRFQFGSVVPTAMIFLIARFQHQVDNLLHNTIMPSQILTSNEGVYFLG